MNAVERFLKYVTYDTQSDEHSQTVPSSEKQKVLGAALAEELNELGLYNAHMDQYGYVYAWLPATPGCEGIPCVGLIAHMDTSPSAPGGGVKPRIVHYTGGDILLNAEQNILMRATDFESLAAYVDQDLIVTDGTTLLGADDKAGVAEIMTAAEYLMAHPEVRHGKIRIGFTPDEEVGRGVDFFDVKAFGADFAYTVDGGMEGELEYENFNAASAKIEIQGRNVHPGYAKNKMINALDVACELQALLQNDHDLNRIEKEKEAKKLERNKVNIQKESAFSQWQEAEKRVEALEVDLENYQKELKAASVDPAVLARITNKTLELKLAVSLQSMSRTRERLASQLAQISEALAETITAETGQTVSFFGLFKQRWPDAALQLDIRIESAPEFFEKLETLQKEGLPKFEANFRDMLNNQARQNLVDLYQEIDNERGKLKLMVSIFGRSTPVELEFWQVERSV